MEKRRRGEVSPSKKRLCGENSTIIKVSNLPASFMENTFKSFLERSRKKEGVLEDTSTTIIKCFDHSKELQHVYVEFSSADVPQALLRRPLVWLKHALRVEIVRNHETASNDSESDNDPDSDNFFVDNEDLIFMSDEATSTTYHPIGAKHSKKASQGDAHHRLSALSPPPKTPKTLKFSNVDSSYSEDNFRAFLSKCLERKCHAPADTNFKLFDYDKDTLSVLVKFDSADIADKVLEKLQFQEYVLEKLIIEEVAELIENRPKILKFSNIDVYTEDNFVAFLSKCLVRKCNVPADTNFKVLHHDKDTRSVLVKFDSADIADEVVEKLQFQEYMLEKMIIEEVEDFAGQSENTEQVHSDEESDLESDLHNEKSSDASKVDDIISVNSKEGEMVLMRKLILHKDAFPEHGSHNLVLCHIQSALRALKVHGTLNELRRVRRNKLETFNRMTKDGRTSSPVYKVLDVAFGKGDVTSLRGTEYDPEKDPPERDTILPSSSTNTSVHSLNDELAKFCAVASWSQAAKLELAHILLANIEEYNKPVRHSQFWDLVSLEMSKSKFYYKADQCKAKHDALVRLHKDYQQQNCTGRPHPSQNGYNGKDIELFEVMSEILKGNVSCEPRVTFSSGFKSQLQLQEITTEERTFRVGSRERPLVLKGREGKKEQDRKANMKKADAMWLFATAYAKKHSRGEDED